MRCSIILAERHFSSPYLTIRVFGKGCILVLQWAEDFWFLVGLSWGFEVHWRSLSTAKFIKITKLYCLGTSVSLISAEREGIFKLSDERLCTVTSISLAGESGMKPRRVNSSLPWGSSRGPCRSKCGDWRPDYVKSLDFAIEMASLHSSASGVIGLEGGGQEDLELGNAHSWSCL